MKTLRLFQRPLQFNSNKLLYPFYHSTINQYPRFFSSAIDQNELLELLKASNSDRQNQSPPNPKHTDHLIEQIRSLHASISNTNTNISTIPAELALNACFFITHHHTDKAMQLSSENVDEFMKFQEIHYQDMNMCWDLLNTPNESGSGNNYDSSKSVWKIEMATRLEDTAKIYQSFMELYNAKNQDFNQLNNDQLMIAFSTIPYIGQWSLMLK